MRLISEDEIITAIEKACGPRGEPVPFRGAYLLEEAEDCEVKPLPGCGHKGFSLRRRIPLLPPAIVPLGWPTDAMKLACIDFGQIRCSLVFLLFFCYYSNKV
eukprot:SAG31_NODE_8739_length_1396_cov_1.981496_2_plen_101_part_01